MANQADNTRKLIPSETEYESVPQGKYLVVTVGINQYDYWRKLNNAVRDATGIQQILTEKFGFTAPIAPLLDAAATKNAIESLVTEQLREIVEEDDNLIIFFAGHGHTRVEKLAETGYIIPVEARLPDSKEYWGDYIRLNHWLQEIAELPARHILVILDACHSGFALGSAMNIYRDAVRYQRDISRYRSRKVITSAQRDQPAIDGGSIPDHSLFTGTLIQGLESHEADTDRNGLITSSELGLYIQQKVAQASESRQTPQFGSFYLDAGGEMVILTGVDRVTERDNNEKSSTIKRDRFLDEEVASKSNVVINNNKDMSFINIQIQELEKDIEVLQARFQANKNQIRDGIDVEQNIILENRIKNITTKINAKKDEINQLKQNNNQA